MIRDLKVLPKFYYKVAYSYVVIQPQKKVEDNGSSLYPEDLLEGDEAETEGQGDRLDHAESGYTFLKPGESQEWERFQERSFSPVDVELGSEAELEDAKIPARISSMSHADNLARDSESRRNSVQQSDGEWC